MKDVIYLMIMYVKVFVQIFDSSIADNYEVRHVFQDLLILADKTGAVDMTAEAIARRTNVPLKKVQAAIKVLCEPDKHSRSKGEDGRRLLPIDSRRDWGWIIANYAHYRAIQDEESRRASWRDAQAKYRAKKVGVPSRQPKKKKKLEYVIQKGGPLSGENSAVQLSDNGDDSILDRGGL
jgi:hypothetical protein